MEKLVCNLESALNLNSKSKHLSEHASLNYFTNTKAIAHKYRHRRLHKKNKVECCNLTKSIVSQAVLSASSLNNLVRIKTPANKPNRVKSVKSLLIFSFLNHFNGIKFQL